jgi:hypothetical protein
MCSAMRLESNADASRKKEPQKLSVSDSMCVYQLTEAEGAVLYVYEPATPIPLDKFIVPDWEDKVDTDIGLSYRHDKLHRLAGRYGNPLPESTMSPIQGL